MKIIILFVFLLAIPFHLRIYSQLPGSLDPSFSVDGKLTTDILGQNDFGRALVIQPDGKIIIAGSSDNGTYLVFSVARYNSDGNLDNSFDSDGILTTDVTGFNN